MSAIATPPVGWKNRRSQVADRSGDDSAYAAALYAALKDDPFYVALEAAVADRSNSRNAMLAYYACSILEAERYGLVLRPDSEPVGLSLWSLPLDEAEVADNKQRKSAAIRAAMGARCLEVYEAITGFMSTATGPLVTDQDWYLSIVGIMPGHQGRGLGEQLVRPALRRADAAGAATFLETFNEKNMPFYRRFGFDTAGSFVEPVTGARYWVMTRSPGG